MLQKSPMYAYLPVTDLARARNFYEQKLGFKPKQEMPGGIIYEFAEGTACFMYPTPQRRHVKGEPGFLAGRRRRA